MSALDGLAVATEALEAALAEGDAGEIPQRDLQKLLAAALRLYSMKADGGEHFPPFRPEDGVTATDVVTGATAMLQAAEIAVFELGMWQAVTGRA